MKIIEISKMKFDVNVSELAWYLKFWIISSEPRMWKGLVEKYKHLFLNVLWSVRIEIGEQTGGSSQASVEEWR